MTSPWDGIFVALWTPTNESGQLLESELRANMEFVKAAGVNGFLALGSTGEFPQLEVDQRKRLLELAIRGAAPLPVMANVSDIRPRVVAELGRFARQVGAAAVTALPPYFFPMAQADLVEFFVRAGEEAGLPLFLYNFPEVTGKRIAPETVAAVADRVPLAGVKQSGAEFEYHRTLIELGRKRNFVVLTGDDTRIPEAVALGAVGCVSGLANAVPELTVRIFEALKAGDSDQANALSDRMKRMGSLISRVEFPLNVAAAIAARGRATGHPKSMVSPDTRKRCEELAADLKRLYDEWDLK